jgi:hypothetical protein
MPHGFVSKAQWRLFYANPRLRRYAHEEAHKVQRERGKKAGFRSLPVHVAGRGRRR